MKEKKSTVPQRLSHRRDLWYDNTYVGDKYPHLYVSTVNLFQNTKKTLKEKGTMHVMTQKLTPILLNKQTECT